MNKLLYLVKDSDGRLALGFTSMEDAINFLRKQAANTDWLQMWTLRWNGTEAVAETSERVVIHFQR